ncbi:4354_t:CDS:2, partial [Racocetra fulgida]
MSNNKVQFAFTAFSATVATAIAIFSYQSFQRQARTRALKRELSSLPPSQKVLQPKKRSVEQLSAVTEQSQFDETLIKEQLARNIAFLGEKGVAKLRKSFIIIVGAGGVGSWAALMLVRSGVEHVRIIDFDQVTLSSLNRHAVATHSDVGIPKVVALQKNFREFAPWVKVEPIIELFTKETVRRRLKKLGVESGIMVAYSTEKPNIKLLPLGTIPAIFGMAIATYIITSVSGYHVEPLANKNREPLYNVHDVGYVYDEIFRSKSVVSGSWEKPALVRWKNNVPLTLQNCVVMTKSEADAHENIDDPETHYPSAVVKLVHTRFQEEKEIALF